MHYWLAGMPNQVPTMRQLIQDDKCPACYGPAILYEDGWYSCAIGYEGLKFKPRWRQYIQYKISHEDYDKMNNIVRNKAFYYYLDAVKYLKSGWMLRYES